MFKSIFLLPKAVLLGIAISVIVSYPLEASTKVKEDTLSVLLNSITISTGVENIKRSPLRLKSVSADEIKIRSAGKTFPEIMSFTPGVYATRESGSYGDAKINIRGFKQDNISVLLNGIPISGLTSGNMFWNNWMGLADATAQIQLQKGIGASMLSDNSVGGTINIITNNSLSERKASVGYFVTSYGTQKIDVNYSTGELSNGWAVSVAGSYVWGSGYVECTNVNSWSYLASVSKKFSDNHSFVFTTLGSPEHHQQRSYRISYAEMEKYGRNYNKNWGWYNNQKKSIAENKYFKPYFTLNHYYNTYLGESNQIALKFNSALYFAIGNGGGLYPEYKERNNQIISFLSDGHIDWDSVVAYNVASGSAKNIISDYLAGHTQFGIKSSSTAIFKNGNEIELGIHYQLYNTWEKERIKDLLGADYWYEDYASNSLAGEAGRNPYKRVGDYIRTNNGKKMDYFTLYLTSTQSLGDARWILKSGASLSGAIYKRWDKYNYISDIYSPKANGIGGSFKAGVLYRPTKGSSFYLNGAVYTRVPYSNVFFAAGNNTISDNVRNENNFLSEFGYRGVANRGGIEITFYSAYWKNKTLMSDKYKPLDGEAFRYMVSGLDAFHYGLEADAFYKFGKVFRLNAFASVGSWKWKNNVNATIYDPYSGQQSGELNVYSNNLRVGDAPQSQFGASFEFYPLNFCSPNNNHRSIANLFINMDWSYNDRFWADFDPSSRTDENDYSNAYRIPSYHLLNARLNIEFNLKNSVFKGISKINLFINANNLTDSKYLERSKDGATHDKTTLTGYWGAPRNYNFGVNILF